MFYDGQKPKYTRTKVGAQQRFKLLLINHHKDQFDSLIFIKKMQVKF
jgi:hypothetical protein